MSMSCHAHELSVPRNDSVADWLIVGAGPAGIAVVGVLIDVGVNPQSITWLDPEFSVGRLGAHYGHVSANSQSKEFINLINACACFQECSCPAIDALKDLDLTKYYELNMIIEPLKCITDHLCTKVHAIRDQLVSLNFEESNWHIGTQQNSVIVANHVVLATGSHPKKLDYKTQQIIPLDVALDPCNLKELIQPQDTVAVVGDAHSAILLLKFLSEMPIYQIYNFYQSPITYAVNLDGWIINATTGLRGVAAEWAYNVLEKNPPANLARIKSTPAILEQMLPVCSKVIYAIGFERNALPPINDKIPVTQYNPTNGLIAPRLFGIGIAFPEKIVDHYGHDQYRIGFTSFMEYAQRIVPHWVNDPFYKQRDQRIYAQLKKLETLSDLFAIWTL